MWLLFTNQSALLFMTSAPRWLCKYASSNRVLSSPKRLREKSLPKNLHFSRQFPPFSFTVCLSSISAFIFHLSLSFLNLIINLYLTFFPVYFLWRLDTYNSPFNCLSLSVFYFLLNMFLSDLALPVIYSLFLNPFIFYFVSDLHTLTYLKVMILYLLNRSLHISDLFYISLLNTFIFFICFIRRPYISYPFKRVSLTVVCPYLCVNFNFRFSLFVFLFFGARIVNKLFI